MVFWGIVDIFIAAGFAFRKYAPHACWAAVCLSGFYLISATWVAPALWLDPLGPLVKVVPGAMLALVARAGLEARR